MVAIARLGAAECLRSGITTVGDLAASRARARTRCAELGLRAIVYLEVFGTDGASALRQFEEKRAYVAAALSERVRVGVSPHAPYTCSREVYAACLALGLPVGDAPRPRAQAELDWLLRGDRPAGSRSADMLVEPAGTTRHPQRSPRPAARPEPRLAHCVKVDEEEIGLLAGHDVAVAHCPRSNALLGCGIAPLAELRAAGIRVGLGTDASRLGPVVRHLRGAARGDLARARASERADALSATDGAGARHPRRRARARARGRDRARSSPASAPTSRSSRSPARRIYHGRIRRPPSSSAARPSGSRLPSSTARPVSREEESNGTS